jgi:hypothetical protein
VYVLPRVVTNITRVENWVYVVILCLYVSVRGSVCVCVCVCVCVFLVCSQYFDWSERKYSEFLLAWTP